MDERAVIFQIGFNRCGTRALARWFGACGYRAAHWNKGRLAQDLIRAKAAGRAPFGAWPHTKMFSDLEFLDYETGALIEGYKEFRFLDECFPNARFLLNTRPVEDWLFSRMRHRNGRYARFYARHYGVTDPRDLLNRWVDDWDDHLTSVRAYFAGRSDKLIEYDLSVDGPMDLAQALQPQFSLEPALFRIIGAPELPGQILPAIPLEAVSNPAYAAVRP